MKRVFNNKIHPFTYASPSQIVENPVYELRFQQVDNLSLFLIKKTTLLILLLVTCFSAVSGQEEIKLRSGQTVIMNKNGTWNIKPVTYTPLGEEIRLSNGQIIIVMPDKTWKVKPALPSGIEEYDLSTGETALLKSDKTWSKKVFNFDLDMVYIKGGSFMMGDTYGGGESDEKPVHKVSVSDFYMSRYEVTQELWKAVIGNNPISFSSCPKCPVENVSWNDAYGFIQKLNVKTGKNYRLPTEAEWEYAAKGGNQSKGYLFSGSNDLRNVSWWWEDNPEFKTHPVGGKVPNELGLHDMSGNVDEWCADWYKGYPGSTGVEDYAGSERVIRGFGHKVTHRYSQKPASSSRGTGFRVALSGGQN